MKFSEFSDKKLVNLVTKKKENMKPQKVVNWDFAMFTYVHHDHID